MPGYQVAVHGDEHVLRDIFRPVPLDQQILKKPQELPPGMIFQRVELASQKEPVTDGIVYIYFLPEGFVNESAIHLHFGEKQHWTIAIHPLTGRADIFHEDVSLDELRQQ